MSDKTGLKGNWTNTKLNPLKIRLDWQNPRIDAGSNTAQDDIRLNLLEHEEVIELAKKIITYGGLVPGENIIVTEENGDFIVLEGNRRVCACQLLIDAALLPKKYAKLFPKTDSVALLENIGSINADVSPSREAAEVILTLRHTSLGAKQWSPLAKMRRSVRLFDQKHSIEEIAMKFSEKPGTIKKNIRAYRLVKYAIDLPGWLKDESRHLTGEGLKISPYTRIFHTGNGFKRLKISYDAQEKIQSGLPKMIFDDFIKRIARGTLILDDNNKPQFDTRCTIDDILGDDLKALDEDKGGESGEQPKGPGKKPQPPEPEKEGFKVGGTPEGEKPRLPQPDRFFENLACKVNDQIIKILVREIRLIKHGQTPTAATMLLRGLFEASLKHQVRKRKLWEQLLESIKKNKSGEKIDPALEKLIHFCLSTNGVFPEKRAKDALEQINKDKSKEYLDLVVHGTWMEADAHALESLAKKMRPLIGYILSAETFE